MPSFLAGADVGRGLQKKFNPSFCKDFVAFQAEL
jgi:hypothetical protein